MKICPSNAIFFAKVGLKFCHILNEPLKLPKSFLKSPSGEISPNLVTLPVNCTTFSGYVSSFDSILGVHSHEMQISLKYESAFCSRNPKVFLRAESRMRIKQQTTYDSCVCMYEPLQKVPSG